jgi:hypothetical protein
VAIEVREEEVVWSGPIKGLKGKPTAQRPPRHGIQRILLLLYGPRGPRITHVEFLVKILTEIYECMIQVHKMTSKTADDGIVRARPRQSSAGG